VKVASQQDRYAVRHGRFLSASNATGDLDPENDSIATSRGWYRKSASES
jgi:hypothetical protein